MDEPATESELQTHLESIPVTTPPSRVPAEKADIKIAKLPESRETTTPPSVSRTLPTIEVIAIEGLEEQSDENDNPPSSPSLLKIEEFPSATILDEKSNSHSPDERQFAHDKHEGSQKDDSPSRST